MPLRALRLAAVLLAAAHFPLLPSRASDRATEAPAPPAEAPHRMSLPEGFQATLFAGEPDVVQPIAFAFDDRGRLWVVECRSYPDWIRDGTGGRDRVLIFEDENGDGSFDSKQVFWDRGTNLSGIEVGFGGVWLCATPDLIFIPVADGGDRPGGPPQVLLDGWSLDAKHNVFNGLTWGPDGWLYGGNGILATSLIGKPGTPPDQRVPLNCGVWRYHPTRHVFEVVAWGTTNPWGLDFDDHGRLFITNCVIEHVFHVIPGARYKRMYGQDLNPHAYGLIESCADHIHWGGGRWQDSRGGDGVHDQPGGGHAHAGAMIYLGDNWPEEYRGGLFTCNIHGHRVNHDVFETKGSGVVARHAPDFLMANDTWFRGLELKYGPDGGVYLTDWTDTGECHDYENVHRENGRIFKITWGDVTPVKPDLAGLDGMALVELHLHRNEWYVRHARRLLQERAAAGRLSPGIRAALGGMIDGHPEVSRRLRALWTLHAIGGLEERQVAALLDSDEEHLRAWAVRLVLDDRTVSPAILSRLAGLARTEPSPVVRLELAAALQRLPLEDRWTMAEALAVRGGDADDHNIPLMLWYGVEPLAAAKPGQAAGLMAEAQIPLVRQFLARRLATLDSAAGLERLVRSLTGSEQAAFHRDVLTGMHEALAGRRSMAMPSGWENVSPRLTRSPDAEVREKATALALVFGDRRAMTDLRRLARDPSADAAERERAILSLVQARDAGLVPVLHALLEDGAVRRAALRGLAAYADAQTPEVILRHYAGLNAEERHDAVNTLASRPDYALALLDAVEREDVPRGDLSAFTVRQLASLGNARIEKRIEQVWGAIRTPSEEKSKLIADYKALLTPERLKDGDRSHGRLVYDRTCASCHVLFGEGRPVGPELTGSQRTNVDYLLENLVDPGAVVGRDYQMWVIVTDEGRVVTGIIAEETDAAITVTTANDTVVIPKDEIDERQRSPLSMMPEGILEKLGDQEVVDLAAYLMGQRQEPLPEDAEVGPGQ